LLNSISAEVPVFADLEEDINVKENDSVQLVCGTETEGSFEYTWTVPRDSDDVVLKCNHCLFSVSL